MKNLDSIRVQMLINMTPGTVRWPTEDSIVALFPFESGFVVSKVITWDLCVSSLKDAISSLANE